MRDDGDLLERLLGFDGRDLKEEKVGLWQRAREYEELVRSLRRCLRGSPFEHEEKRYRL